jgi:hypothetical protein
MQRAAKTPVVIGSPLPPFADAPRFWGIPAIKRGVKITSKIFFAIIFILNYFSKF